MTARRAGAPRRARRSSGVLAAIPRRAFLDVELKGDPGRGAVEVLAAGRGPGLERAVVSSFEPATLERRRRLAPSWPRWLNADGPGAGDDRGRGRARVQGISAEWQRSTSARCGVPVPPAWRWPHGPSGAGRRSTGSSGSGVVAVCVEAAALDG